MAVETSRLVPIAALRTLIEAILGRLGCEPDVTTTVADMFVEANLRGHSGQGLEHFIYSMVRSIKSGRINPRGRPRVIKEGEAFALVDGETGPGQVAAVFAADLAVQKAAHAGCSVIGIVDSRDIYMVGYYAERIARAGSVGVIFTDGIPLVHPYGGIERVLGTNPIAIGVPTAGVHPIVLDLATCAGLFRDIWGAALRKEEIPEGLAVGADGLPTRSGPAALKGALSPLGGHKGYGLALCVGLLSGPLVGAAVGRATGSPIVASAVLDSGEVRADIWERLGKEDFGPTGSKGHLFVAVNPAVFGDEGTFRNAVTAYINEIKTSRRAPGVSEILVPGERSFRERDRNLVEGTVPIEERVWADALRLASVLNVRFPG